MKSGCLMVLGLGLAVAAPAFSQVSVYADVSASKLTNLVQTNVLYGPTIGLTAYLGTAHSIKIAGDVRASFYGGKNRLDGVAVGPRISRGVKGFEPYGEMLVGFARYNDGLGTASSGTTDAQLEFNGGVDRKVSKRLDWRIFEYGYEEYYGLGGQFNPKTFSTGIVYHLGK